ncbi:MAG: hypothetical protein WCT99_09230 [Bacteroidota bacterium]
MKYVHVLVILVIAVVPAALSQQEQQGRQLVMLDVKGSGSSFADSGESLSQNVFYDRDEMIQDLQIQIDDLKRSIIETKSMVQPQPLFPTLKVGVLAQFQGQALQEQLSALQQADPNYTQHWQRQMYVRRFRVLVGGTLSPSTSFFFESDAPNIGRTAGNGTKASSVNMYVQDAQIQQTISNEFGVIAGLQLVGISRNSLQSAASLMSVNYGAYQFVTSGPLDNLVGRDLGINSRGYFLDDRLEYRAGIFSGKNTNQYSPLRVAARINYNFLDKEKGYYYSGTALGKGNYFEIGGGVDLQGTYSGAALDGFYDAPLGALGSVTVSAGFTHLDGGGSDRDSSVIPILIPKQNILFFEAGFFLKEMKLQPYVKYESQDVSATVLKQVGAVPSTLDYQNALRSNYRVGGGVNYYIKGHTASVKVLYEIVYRNRASTVADRFESASNGELTIQLQYFFF